MSQTTDNHATPPNDLTNMLIEHSTETNILIGSNDNQQQQQSLATDGDVLLNTEDINNSTNQNHGTVNQRPFVNAPFGLFPMPFGHAAKLSQISRTKSKFKFLGKFMAKAIMDSRMVSIQNKFEHT